MKKIILTILCLVGCVYSHAQSDTNLQNTITSEQELMANWQTTFKEAVLKAKSDKKPILVYFTGSDWCGPCKRLDKELFRTQKFIDYADKNLVLYKADYPQNKDLVTPENRKTNKQLSERYQQQSFPTMIVINDKGEVLGRKNGWYMAEFYYPFFENIVSSLNK